jgi:hypothetical protein
MAQTPRHFTELFIPTPLNNPLTNHAFIITQPDGKLRPSTSSESCLTG